MAKSITCFDWSLYAGEKEGVFWGRGGYRCSDGERIDYRRKRMGIRYDATKERLTVWGQGWIGPCLVNDRTVMFRESKGKPGRFRGDLTRDDFRKILADLKDSESRHRQAQIDRLDRMKEAA